MTYPILFFHGTPGNDHQAYAFKAFSFVEIITWNRNFNDICTPYAGKAHIVALSGGGPYALEYITKFPGRAVSLTMWSALTGPPDGKKFPPRPFGRFIINMIGRQLLKSRAEWAWRIWLKQNAASQEIYDQAVDDQRSQNIFWEIVKSQIPFKLDDQLRREINFLKNYAYNQQNIYCPTYTVHDINDKNVPFQHAQRMQIYYRNVKRFATLKSTGHLCFFGHDAQNVLKHWANWISSI